MSRKLIELQHHMASGCCMWSGIEDIYATKTGQTLPEAFLFGLSSYAETAFIKTGESKKPFMFSIADGRTRKTYDRIKDVLGMQYKISEGRTLKYALHSVKKEIDEGNLVILGPLDMYHLPYLKMYHRYHIPMHYILMVGYDDEKNCLLVYDCDRTELLELPESELIKAWQIKNKFVGDKNGFVRFSLSDTLKTKDELAEICLKQKADRQLCVKPDMVGVSAYSEIANELPLWKERLTSDQYKAVLVGMTESFGMVPKLPNEIMGVSGEDISYQGCYDRFSKMLIQLGTEFERSDWLEAGKLFQKCGKNIEEIVNHIIQYYKNDKECLSEIQELFLDTGRHAEKAYEIIKEGKYYENV